MSTSPIASPVLGAGEEAGWSQPGRTPGWWGKQTRQRQRELRLGGAGSPECWVKKDAHGRQPGGSGTWAH